MMHRNLLIAALLISAGLVGAGGPDEPKVEIAATVCFLEGPAVDAEGNVFFSDIAGNRIMKMDPRGQLSAAC
jgi:sugar lactone lactonase YvrE